jgi:hypothetical protein
MIFKISEKVINETLRVTELWPIKTMILSDQINAFHKDQLKKNSVFEKKITRSEKEYLLFIINFFSELDANIVSIRNSLEILLNKKDYRGSMFLLRGLIEALVFNIFVTSKLFYHYKKKNYFEFFKLTFKTGFSSNEKSLKKTDLYNSSSVYKKIIENKKKGNRTHIQSCIEFYIKTDFLKLVNNTNQIKDFVYFKNEDLPLQKSKFKSIFGIHTKENYKKYLDYPFKNKLPINYSGIKRVFNYSKNKKMSSLFSYTYDKLCELIHPTSINIYSSRDKLVVAELKILLYFTKVGILYPLTQIMFRYKEFMIKKIKENKDEYINNFRYFLKD